LPRDPERRSQHHDDGDAGRELLLQFTQGGEGGSVEPLTELHGQALTACGVCFDEGDPEGQLLFDGAHLVILRHSLAHRA
jgi:hypothetical protein